MSNSFINTSSLSLKSMVTPVHLQMSLNRAILSMWFWRHAKSF